LFTKNCLSQFAAIHKLREIQRQALNLTALRHGNAKERKDIGRCSRSSRRSRRRRSRAWSGAGHLRFILATKGAAAATLSWGICRSSRGTSDLGLILATTRATSTSWSHRGSKVQTRTSSVSHEHDRKISQKP
jgi:hypothetical protein